METTPARFTAARREEDAIVLMLVSEDDFEDLESDADPAPWTIRGYNSERAARTAMEHRAAQCPYYELADNGRTARGYYIF